MNFDRFMINLLFHFRWVFVCLILLPCSIMYDLYLFLEKVITSWSKKELSENHYVKTKSVQDQINCWRQKGQTTPMCLGRPGWKAMTTCELKYKQQLYNIHVDLEEILGIDFERKTIKVEPLVTMGQISAYLNPLGLTLPIVAELDDLTVGGLVMGSGIESSSHVYGLFQHICESYELLLADGSLVQCSKEEDPDLYYAIPWSCGTLGFLTAVELKIIPSKRYVKLLFEPFYSLEEGVQLCKDRSKNKTDNEFVEGIMFNKNEGVIMTGKMVDDGQNVNKIARWYKPWFYKHVQSFLERGTFEECIPLRDYYHRHTKSLFWEMEDILSFGNYPLFRWLFGWMLPIKISLLKRTQTEFLKDLYKKEHVCQDLIIPIQHLKEALLFFDEEVKVYPVWLCPALIPSEPGLVHSSTNQSEIYVDIGLYGIPKTKNYHYIETTKRLEHFTIKVKGPQHIDCVCCHTDPGVDITAGSIIYCEMVDIVYQMFHPGTFCSEEEFETMFDHKLYNKMRDKLNCNKAFPRVYGKLNKRVRE